MCYILPLNWKTSTSSAMWFAMWIWLSKTGNILTLCCLEYFSQSWHNLKIVHAFNRCGSTSRIFVTPKTNPASCDTGCLSTREVIQSRPAVIYMTYCGGEEAEDGADLILVPHPDTPVCTTAEEQVRFERWPKHFVHRTLKWWIRYCQKAGPLYMLYRHNTLYANVILSTNHSLPCLLCA